MIATLSERTITLAEQFVGTWQKAKEHFVGLYKSSLKDVLGTDWQATWESKLDEVAGAEKLLWQILREKGLERKEYTRLQAYARKRALAKAPAEFCSPTWSLEDTRIAKAEVAKLKGKPKAEVLKEVRKRINEPKNHKTATKLLKNVATVLEFPEAGQDPGAYLASLTGKLQAHLQDERVRKLLPENHWLSCLVEEVK